MHSPPLLRRWKANGFWLAWLLGWLVRPLAGAELPATEVPGLRVAPGFRISLYADADLANDIQAMTLDAHGRVVVSGPGYIKTLLDTKLVGRADQAELFAATRTGGMGLCFDGSDLYFSGDGFFSVYHDANGDGQADGEPDRWFPVHTSEHGGHALRKGPDGWWYLLGGNDSGFDARHVTLPASPVRTPEAGALLRVSPDGKNSEVIAHGLRNPYDFDFNWLGDLFTYDSDVESDFFLPWYTPTRLYHLGYGGHHGWRLNGWTRSWNRPGYYADTVDVLAAVGRGSPTGVVSYRHTQFPQHYRDGLFVLDWTFGRILFFPLASDGAGYRTQSEVFLEATGTQGFAPTDVVVAADGSLFVSIGGRKTRGAVYRIQYDASVNDPALLAEIRTLESVLHAPQPLDAWSRARWQPAAQQLGRPAFSRAVMDPKGDVAGRVRAIEILTEMFGGLGTNETRSLVRELTPVVRARAAWSLGRVPCDRFASFLLPLALDPQPLVRRCALEALADHAAQIPAANLVPALAANLGHDDKRVRLAAARLGTLLPAPVWENWWSHATNALPATRLTAALVAAWRDPAIGVNTNLVESVLSVFRQPLTVELRLQAVRLLILALGDYHLQEPSLEAWTAFEPAAPLAGHAALVARLGNVVRPLVPSGHPLLDAEATRLLAMLEDKDPALPKKIIAFCTAQSAPPSDFHSLTVLSRLPPATTNAVTAQVARAILGLDAKLQGQQERPKQNWTLRLQEVVTRLVRRDPALPDALLRQPDFATPGHLALVSCLGTNHQTQAARQYLAAVERNARFPWSAPLIDLLAHLPGAQVRTLFRNEWAVPALRDDLVFQLALRPEAEDRAKFLLGLASANLRVVRVCVGALRALPPDDTANDLLPHLRLLQRLLAEPDQAALRQQLLALIARDSHQPFKVEEHGTDAVTLRRDYSPVLDQLTQKNPYLLRALNGAGNDDPVKWGMLFRATKWDAGNAAAGATIFQERGCAACHVGGHAIGPDLAGAAARYSVEELMGAIVFPSRDIAPPYRATTFHLRDGESYSGLVAFTSADGVLVVTGPAASVRLAQADIVAQEASAISLMPAGLLNDLRPAAVADLYAYLKSLAGPAR